MKNARWEFSGGNSRDESLIGGNCPGGSFPDIKNLKTWQFVHFLFSIRFNIFKSSNPIFW